MPAYEKELRSGKGPQLFSYDNETVAPDMLVFKNNGILWIEAKSKTVFSWHRKTEKWTTGIDLRHYEHYLTVMKKTSIPVWLLFLHISPLPDSRDRSHSPPECPVGLFGNDLAYLRHHENHRCLPKEDLRQGMKGHGNSGMVYWAHDQLKLVCSLKSVLFPEPSNQV